jgi:hypothetical protein
VVKQHGGGFANVPREEEEEEGVLAAVLVLLVVTREPGRLADSELRRTGRLAVIEPGKSVP